MIINVPHIQIHTYIYYTYFEKGKNHTKKIKEL